MACSEFFSCVQNIRAPNCWHTSSAGFVDVGQMILFFGDKGMFCLHVFIQLRSIQARRGYRIR